MTPRRSILIVHGRDFKPSADVLFELTLAALRSGIERDYPDAVGDFDGVHCDLAYYADLSNALLSGRGKNYDEHLDTLDRNTALAALRSIPTRKRFGIRQYDRLPGKSALPEFIADVFAPLLRVLGLWMWVCKHRSRDFYEYLSAGSDYGEQVRARVREKLEPLLENGDRILLMTHGTGSAVAWDVLWELSHDPRYADLAGARIEIFLTMGSPLGDNFVRKRLFGAREKGLRSYPSNIVTWHNVSAEDDYTCHDGTLADDFRKMPSRHLVSGLWDYTIYNHAVRYGRSHPHSSIGYYIHPRVSKIVTDWLKTEDMVTADGAAFVSTVQ